MYSLRHQDIQLEMHGKPRKFHSGWLAALVRPYSSSVTSEAAYSVPTTNEQPHARYAQ